MSHAVRPGLCSVTFRELAPDRIIALAAETGLAGIEWGGDVHLPPGDVSHAEDLQRRCADAGLACPSYGSYFFAGFNPREDLTAVIDTTLALRAKVVRVWLPFGVESDAPATERARIADELAFVVAQASDADLKVALEFHPGTLTHTAAAARTVLDAVGHPGLFTYWQPEPGTSLEHGLAEFRAVRVDVAHLHVFSWDPDADHRRPLDHFESLWKVVLTEVREPGRWNDDRFAFLEFVANDDPHAFRRDAATLRAWLSEGAP